MFEKIGDILIRHGFLDKAKLQQALSQNYMDKKIGEVLIGMNLITEDQLTQCLADQAGVDFLKSDQILVADEKACRLVSEDFAKANRLIPVTYEGNTVLVAMADPEDIVVLDNLKKSMPGKDLVTRMGGEARHQRGHRAHVCAHPQVERGLGRHRRDGVHGRPGRGQS